MSETAKNTPEDLQDSTPADETADEDASTEAT